MREETKVIVEDTCFRLTIAVFYLFMVSFIIPLPGDRGRYLNHYWPVKETAVTHEVSEVKEYPTPLRPEPVVFDQAEIYVKAVRKVYKQDFPLSLARYSLQQAEKYKLDPRLVIGVIAAESSFIPSSKSWVGAVGYMQVWPRWHQDRIRGRDITNPYINIEVGVNYLNWCLEQRGGVYEALSCYNGSDSKASADRYFQRVMGRSHELSLAALEVAGI